MGLTASPWSRVPLVRTICFFGTSITNANSDSLGGGTSNYVSTRSSGFGAVAQTVLEHRFALARRSNAYTAAGGSPDADHGYSGATCAKLLSGGLAGYEAIVPISDAKATGADAIVIEAGANDTALGASAMAAAILALVDAARGHFKKVFVLNVLPRGSGAGSTVRDTIISVNATLATEVPARGCVLVDAWTAIPKDADNYALATHIHDGTHPSAAGGIVIGKVLAEALRPYCRGDAYVVPSVASGKRLTSNFLEVGSGSLPTGWAQSVAGSGRSYSAITDGDGTKWQRFIGTPTNPSTAFIHYNLLAAQCEALYANAANSNSGTASITVTSALLSGGALTVPFSVTAGMTAAQWIEAARAELVKTSAIISKFDVGVSASTIIGLRVVVPDRTDATFRLTAQLPGVGPTVGWQRWLLAPYSLGGYRQGDTIRCCGILRTVDGYPVTSLGIALSIYAGGTKVNYALGYPASVSGTIDTVTGLYMTEPLVVPASCDQLQAQVIFYTSGGSGACDVRSCGIFIE